MTELPAGWAEARVDDVAQVVRGVTYKKDEARSTPANGLVPLLRATNINGRLDFRDLYYVPAERVSSVQYMQDGDILVASSSGSSAVVGKSAQLSGAWSGTFGGFCAVIRHAPPLVPRYLGHYLASHVVREHWSDLARGSNINNLKVQHFVDTPVPIAPLAEQERIVAAIEEAFSKLDAGEAGLRTVRQLLKRMRDSILTAAVTGRLVPQDPTDTPAAKLLADLRVEATAKPVHLPPGWAQVRLGDIAEAISGPAFKSSQFGGPDDGVRLLRGENIEPGSLRWRDTRTWPNHLLDRYRHLLVEATDIILAMDRPLISTGLKLAQVRPDDLPALLVQRVARIRPTAPELRPYAWLALRDPRFINHLVGGQVGTQLPHITLQAIRDYDVAMPGPDEMARLVAEADRQLSGVTAVERAIEGGFARSAALRRSVLKAAFGGKLVPQDPSDEPASVLLERIRAERAAAPKQKSRRARTTV